jgi:hypothetical protein
MTDSGCGRHGDCFTCPFPDCIADTTDLGAGTVHRQIAHGRGWPRYFQPCDTMRTDGCPCPRPGARKVRGRTLCVFHARKAER